jgi:hypothetical protein
MCQSVALPSALQMGRVDFIVSPRDSAPLSGKRNGNQNSSAANEALGSDVRTASRQLLLESICVATECTYEVRSRILISIRRNFSSLIVCMKCPLFTPYELVVHAAGHSFVRTPCSCVSTAGTCLDTQSALRFSLTSMTELGMLNSGFGA